MLTSTTRVAARADVLSCEVGDAGAVLLDPRAGVYLGVDGTAALLWATLVRGPASIADLCGAMLAEYEVAPATCEADVRVFVDDLLRRDLAMVVPEDEAGSHGA